MNFKEWLELIENYDYYGAFQRWYDNNRGSWKQVEAAADKDPRVRYLLNTAMGHLDSFGGPMYQKIADALEKRVGRQFPDHSKYQPSHLDTQQAAKVKAKNDLMNGATKGPSSAGGDNGFELNRNARPTPAASARPGTQASQNTQPYITQTLSDHERRLKSLEAYFARRQQAASPRGNNNTTAAYPVAV